MVDLDTKEELKELTKLTRLDSIVPGVDLYKWGSLEHYRYRGDETTIVTVIGLEEATKALERYLEQMSVPCSESIADFSAQRDVYLSLKKKKEGLKQDRYLVESRTIKGT